MAIEFYQTVAGSGNWLDADIALAGHSLGGGLAGVVAGLYQQQAHVYDSMDYLAALIKFYAATDSESESYDPAIKTLLYGSASPWAQNPYGIDAWHLEGEALGFLRLPTSTSVGLGATFDLVPGNIIDEAVERHDIASLIIAMFGEDLMGPGAWQNVAPYFWPVMYDNTFANQIGVGSIEGQLSEDRKFSQILRQIIAYSVVDEGGTTVDGQNAARPFGDAAIRALYNDANDLGLAAGVIDVSPALQNSLTELSMVMVHYAGQLALQKSVDIAYHNGVFTLTEDALTVDFTEEVWKAGAGNLPPMISRDILVDDFLDGYGMNLLVRKDMLDLWGSGTSELISNVSYGLAQENTVTIDPVISTLNHASMYIGGEETDVVYGSLFRDLIFTLVGDDIIYAGSDDDIVFAGDGEDIVYGEDGHDILVGGDHDDHLYGGNGDDWLRGNSGDDVLNGGSGTDVADYIMAASGVTLNLALQEASNDGDGGEDTFVSIERARGSNYSDFITGTSGNETIYGSEGNDVIDGNGGYDHIDYSYLRDRVGVSMGALGVAVAKGVSSSLGNDILTSDFIAVTGTGYNDSFSGSLQGAGNLILSGGAGSDIYTFNLGVDSGSVHIFEYDSKGLDSISLVGFDTNTMRMKLGLDGYGNLAIEVQEETVPDTWLTFLNITTDYSHIVSGMGVDSLSFGGGTYRLSNVVGYADSQSGNFFYNDTIESVYDYSSGGWNGSAGAAGGTMVRFSSGGAISGMHFSPIFTHNWVPYAYAQEIMHPGVITHFASGGGATQITMKTYLKELAFHAGISIDDVRLTTSGSSGSLSLVINIDALGQSFTIPDFESGRTLTGLGIYNTALHDYIEEASGAVLTRTGSGQYGGNYTSASAVPNYSGSISITYFLETMSFYDGSLDMLGTMTFEGTDASNILHGLNRGDVIYGYGGNDTIYGYDGDDTLYGGEGGDLLYGGNGDDHLYGGVGADTFYGGNGDDTYYFSVGFVGASGQYDSLNENTGAGTDTLRFMGVAVSDLRSWATNATTFFSIAGSPDDVLRISHSTGASGTDFNDRVERIVFDDETVWDLTAGLIMTDTDDAHYLYGSAQADMLDGRGGNDYIYGHDGNDTLYGGDGIDVLYGGDGDDHLYGGADRDVLNGGNGDDTYYFSVGFVGASDQYEALNENIGAGTDTLRFMGVAVSDLRSWATNVYTFFSIAGSPDDVLRISHSTGASGTDFNDRVERIVFDDETVWDLTAGLIMTDTDDAHYLYGSAQADMLDGRGGNDYIYGHDGNDTLYGGDGIDVLYGGNGNDHLYGGAGYDTLVGGAGDDTYYFSAGFVGVANYYDNLAENTGGGTDTLRFTGIAVSELRSWADNYYTFFSIAGSPNDVLRASHSMLLTGSDFNNRIERIVFDDTTLWDLTAGLIMTDTDDGHNLMGSGQADVLDGRGGNDTIYGYDGDDTLYGGDGNDSINGGNGNDHLYGGAGIDTLTGGAGADEFVFESAHAYGAVDTISDFSTAQGDAINLVDLLSSYDPLTDAITDFVLMQTSGGNTTVSVDSDGTGSTYGWIQIATLSSVTGLTDEVALVTNGNLIVA